MKKLLSKVLIEIKPSKEYEKEILGKANFIINKIKNLKDVKVILGGSGFLGGAFFTIFGIQYYRRIVILTFPIDFGWSGMPNIIYNISDLIL